MGFKYARVFLEKFSVDDYIHPAGVIHVHKLKSKILNI